MSFLVYQFQEDSNIKYAVELPPDAQFLSEQQIIDLLREDRVYLEDSTEIRVWSDAKQKFSRLKSSLIVTDETRLLIPYVQDPASQEFNQRLERLDIEASRLLDQIEMQSKTTGLDIAIFSSCPLIFFRNATRNTQATVSFADNELNVQAEKQELLTAFNSPEMEGIGINLWFEAATINNLFKIIDIHKPKIVHISCHGFFEEHPTNKGTNFYLAFEDDDHLGHLYKLKADKLLDFISSIKVETVIAVLSAWYSAEICDAFLQSGIKCVVCVHQDCKILGQAADKFSSHFYKNLLRGETIQDAFDKATGSVGNVQHNLPQACCCSHEHDPGCLWHKLIDRNHVSTAKAACNEHTPDKTICHCEDFNNCEHEINCKWAIQFFAKYNPKRLHQETEEDAKQGRRRVKTTDEEKKSGRMRVCCCKTHAPHGESKKFCIKYQKGQEAQIGGMRPFAFHNRQEVSDINPIEAKPPPNITKPINGRNIEIQSIVEEVLGTSRLVHVTGEPGVGKSEIVKSAANYLYERGKFKDGIVYKDLSHKHDIYLLTSRIGKKLGKNTPQHMDLYREIHQRRILIILDTVDDMIKNEPEKLVEKIKWLIENTSYAKFVLVSAENFEFGIENSSTIRIDKMHTHDACKLILNLYGSYFPPENDYRTNLKFLYSKKKFLDYVKSPSEISRLGPLFEQAQEDTASVDIIDSVYNIFITRYNDKESSHRILRQNLERLSTSEEKYHELEILVYLCYLPAGAYDFELDILLQNKAYNWRSLICDIDDSEENIYHFVETRQCGGHLFKAREKVNENVCKSIFQEANPIYRRQDATVILDWIIMHLSAMARAILRALIKQTKGKDTELALLNFNASLDYGIWESQVDERYVQRLQAQIEQIGALKVFHALEDNFMNYVDRGFLGQILPQNKDYLIPEDLQIALGEIAVCVTTIYVHLGGRTGIKLERSYSINSPFSRGILQPGNKSDSNYKRANRIAEQARYTMLRYRITRYSALLYLIQAHICVIPEQNSQKLEYAMEKAKKALRQFKGMQSEDPDFKAEGVAEAKFLIMFIEQKLQQRPWNEDISLKFESSNSFSLSPQPSMKLCASLEYDDAFYDAEVTYSRLNCKIGLARLTVLHLEYLLRCGQVAPETETKLLTSLEVFREWGYNSWTMKALKVLGSFYTSQKLEDKAKQYYQEAKDLAINTASEDEYNMLKEMTRGNKKLKSIY